MELELKGNLIKPVQRLTKYPLLINAIIKNTPTDHPDYENLTIASFLISEIVTVVNQSS